MTVAFDNTFLTLAFNPNSKPCPNPATGEPVSYCKLRVEALIDSLSESGDTVVIPTPCFAELLAAVPDMRKAIRDINKSAVFELAPFDARCAIDLADVLQRARASGDKTSGIKAGYQEVKFDRQIAVIAKVAGAKVFYTDDRNQSGFAELLGLTVKHTWDLDLPPKYAQTSFIGEPDDGEKPTPDD